MNLCDTPVQVLEAFADVVAAERWRDSEVESVRDTIVETLRIWYAGVLGDH